GIAGDPGTGASADREDMDTVNDIFAVFNDLTIVAGTVLATLFLLLRSVFMGLGTALLSAFGRGAGAGIGTRFAGGQLASRRLPTNPTQRLARQALYQAEARQVRMETYNEAWLELVTLRGGPYALSVHLLGMLSPGFRDKVDRLRTRSLEFDRLEERAQRIVQRYERDYQRVCEPLRDEVRALDVELSRWKARDRRFALQFWRRRWRHAKRRHLRLRFKVVARRWHLHRTEWRLNLRYRGALEPALRAVDRYERAYLTHWIHSFEADLESFRLTILSGRLMEIVRQPARKATIGRLGLADLPDDAAALRSFLIEGLAASARAVAPGEPIESLFETWLRDRLAASPELCALWQVDPAWLRAHLPPPGSLGVVHERYLHVAPRPVTDSAAEATRA
ncbi:MAG: hypothetical protein R3D33_16690, partial [Hyphomicrobiaceae bacterium]